MLPRQPDDGRSASAPPSGGTPTVRSAGDRPTAPLAGGAAVTGASPADDVELIVLVAPDGTPVGTAPKLASHHHDTPLHLAFSSYVFGADGRFLLTRRAVTKKTWPGTWTNSCCGHPGPAEEPVSALRRRLVAELGLTPVRIEPLLPDFRYRAELDGVVENEICPVYAVRVDGEPHPDPAEVAEYRWVDWDDVLAGRLPGPLSPWAALQVAQLADHPLIAELRTPLR